MDLALAIGSQERVRLGSIVDRLGPASLGLLLLVIAAVALIPIPGPFGMASGACLGFVALQVVGGARTVWLPGWLRRRALPVRYALAAIERVVPRLAWIERHLSRGRLAGLSGRAAQPLLGLLVLFMAVIIALPIPFGNVLPVLAVGIIALAIIERDGAAVLAGVAAAVVAALWTALLLLFGAQLIETAWGLFA